MREEIAIKKLNEALHHLEFQYYQNEFESSLAISNFPPIFFSNDAGGDILGGSDNWIRKKHADGSIHEPATVAAFLFVQQNFPEQIKVFFDIGALYGYFGLIGKSLFPHSATYSFEMNPVSYSALVRNVNSNKHLDIPAVRCINVGLTDNTVFQKKVSVSQFTLMENSKSLNKTSMDLISLDDFCRLGNVKPNLIKIDVEGYQAKILPGGIKTIKEARPIILLEFDSPVGLKQFDTTNKQIVKPLFDLGYKLYWCGNQRGIGRFEKLDYDSFSEEHEINSLGIFLPH